MEFSGQPKIISGTYHEYNCISIIQPFVQWTLIMHKSMHSIAFTFKPYIVWRVDSNFMIWLSNIMQFWNAAVANSPGE